MKLNRLLCIRCRSVSSIDGGKKTIFIYLKISEIEMTVIWSSANWQLFEVVFVYFVNQHYVHFYQTFIIDDKKKNDNNNNELFFSFQWSLIRSNKSTLKSDFLFSYSSIPKTTRVKMNTSVTKTWTRISITISSFDEWFWWKLTNVSSFVVTNNWWKFFEQRQKTFLRILSPSWNIAFF